MEGKRLLPFQVGMRKKAKHTKESGGVLKDLKKFGMVWVLVPLGLALLLLLLYTNFPEVLGVKITRVARVAGSAGARGFADGQGASARFNGPEGLAIDPPGNLYVTDTYNDLIRKITPEGVVTTLAGSPGTLGSADGMGPAAQFRQPEGIAMDAAGNLYIADMFNHAIRKMNPQGLVTTLAGSEKPGYADGKGKKASFNQPFGVTVDASGTVYVTEIGNHLIRKISPEGMVTTVAGSGRQGFANGTGLAASFSQPHGLAVDGAGNLYVADTANQMIRKITPAGLVLTLAGSGRQGSVDGPGPGAEFNFPIGIALGPSGSVYVADTFGNKIRKITAGGMVSTVAGSGALGSDDGKGGKASFSNPFGIEVDTLGNVYVSDWGSHLIRKIGKW